MRRISVVLALLVVVAICGFSAWFALRVGPEEGGKTGKAPVVNPEGVDAAPDSESKPGDGDAARKRVVSGESERADANRLVGRIVYGDAGVAGARVEAYAAPSGEYNERIDEARRIFGDLFSEDELKAMEDRFGGMRNFGGGGGDDADGESTTSISVSVGSSGGGVSATDGEGAPIDLSNLDLENEDMQDAMGAGMEFVGRMFSDPSFLEKAIDLGRIEAAGFQRDAEWPRAGAVLTDSEGRFEITNLPAGDIELRIRASGFVRSKKRVKTGADDVQVELSKGALLEGMVVSVGQPVDGASVRTKTTTLTTSGGGTFRLDGAVTPRESLLVTAPGFVAVGMSVPLAPDATNTPVVVELVPAARISGVVIGTNGAPVPGAMIRVSKGGKNFNMMSFMELANRENVKAPAPQTTTDANGVFELDGVPGGSVMIAAEKPGFLSDLSEPIDAIAGDSVDGIEITLLRASTVTGQVVGPDGSGVDGATVKVALDAPEGMGGMLAGMFGGSWATARTDGSGRYEVSGLREGERKVRVESTLHLHQEAAVQVPAEDGVSKDFTLELGYTLEGLVLTPDGDPAVAARVDVKWKKESAGNPMAAMMGGFSGADARTVTDEEGRFQLNGLQAGPYDLTAKLVGYLDGEIEDITTDTEALIQLRSAASIEGRVVDVDGNPVGGAWVHRKGGPRRGGGNPFMAMMQQGPKVMTDADGRFSHGELEPGTYTLFARREAYADSESVKVKVGEGEHSEGSDLMLRAGESLSGVVVVRGGGGPVVGATVYVSPNSGPNLMAMMGRDNEAPAGAVKTTTGEDGSFLLEGLTPGKVTVEVRHADHAPASLARVEVPGTEVSVELGVGGSVEGTVVDADGNAVAGMNIVLTSGAMGMGRNLTATTDAAGFYRIERVVPGAYSVMKMGGDSMFGMDGMSQIVVREGEVVRKDFRPERKGGKVAGAVTRDGKPVSGAMVVLAGGSVGMKLTSTKADGSFDFDALPAGSYTVSVQAEMMGGGTNAQQVTVDENGNVSGLDLRLSSLTFEGRVVDADTGDGVAMAQVVLFDPSVGTLSSIEEIMRNQRGQAITDSKGRFSIVGVADGTFSLRVSSPGYAEATREGVNTSGGPVTMKVSQGAEFQVTVLGPDGDPLQGATVVAQDSEGRETFAFGMAAMQGVTDSSGVTTIRLAPGRYTLVAETSGLPSSSVAVDASRGSVVIRLEGGGGIEVVVRRDGSPMSGARITVLDEDGNALEKRISMSNLVGSGMTTDSAGRATREGLPAGELTVVVAPPEGEPVRKTVTVGIGRTATVNFDL